MQSWQDAAGQQLSCTCDALEAWSPAGFGKAAWTDDDMMAAMNGEWFIIKQTKIQNLKPD